MSFDCRYKDRQDHCRRIDGVCVAGQPGCVLYGRFVFARDVDDKRSGSNRKGKKATNNASPRTDENPPE